MDIEKLIEEQKESFELHWGIAPEGTLKYDKGREFFKWHIKSLIQFIDAEIERLREGRKLPAEESWNNIFKTSDEVLAYNQAVSETISHLEDIKSKLNNN